MITQVDAVKGLRGLEPGSVDLVLSDPPSGHTLAEFDNAPDLGELWPAIWRALKPGGAAVLMASSIRFAAQLIASQPKSFRYDLVWHKNMPTGFLNAKRQPLRCHEFILVFCHSGTLYHPQMTQDHAPITSSPGRVDRTGSNYGSVADDKYTRRTGATSRFPRSVLPIKCAPRSGPKRIHPQQKPTDLMAWLVRTYSNPGDLVVDPYAGSGSTGHAAIAEGRRFAGFDLNKYGPKS